MAKPATDEPSIVEPSIAGPLVAEPSIADSRLDTHAGERSEPHLWGAGFDSSSADRFAEDLHPGEPRLNEPHLDELTRLGESALERFRIDEPLLEPPPIGNFGSAGASAGFATTAAGFATTAAGFAAAAPAAGTGGPPPRRGARRWWAALAIVLVIVVGAGLLTTIILTAPAEKPAGISVGEFASHVVARLREFGLLNR